MGSLIFQFAKSLLSEKIRSRFKTHSGLESLQRSVDPSFLPAEYGGTTSVAECIANWKVELEEGRAELLQLDQLKVDSSAPVGEQLALVRKVPPRQWQWLRGVEYDGEHAKA